MTWQFSCVRTQTFNSSTLQLKKFKGQLVKYSLIPFFHFGVILTTVSISPTIYGQLFLTKDFAQLFYAYNLAL
jgi:hypothetical protein